MGVGGPLQTDRCSRLQASHGLMQERRARPFRIAAAQPRYRPIARASLWDNGGPIKRGYLLRGMPFACRLQWFGAVGLAGLLAFDVNPSAAGEAAYCITCTGPDQTYLCRVTGEGSSQNDVFKLYCIVRTAKQGRHATCAATGSAESCRGVVKNYNYRGPSLPASLAENPRVKRFISRMEEDQATDVRSHSPPRQENASSPPQSRFRRVKHAAYNAGAAVGRFGGTTYRCLRSLFRNCSGKAR